MGRPGYEAWPEGRPGYEAWPVGRPGYEASSNPQCLSFLRMAWVRYLPSQATLRTGLPGVHQSQQSSLL